MEKAMDNSTRGGGSIRPSTCVKELWIEIPQELRNGSAL